MPDWTYEPLRTPAARVVGVRRSQRWAVSLLSAVSLVPGGRGVIRMMADTRTYAELVTSVAGAPTTTPVGISVGPSIAARSLRGIPSAGAGFVEVGPWGADDIEPNRAALGAAAAPVFVRCATGELSAVHAAIRSTDLVAGYVDGDVLYDVSLTPAGVVIRDASPNQVAAQQNSQPGQSVVATTDSPDPAHTNALREAGADGILLTSAALVAGGPGTLNHLTRSLLPPPVAPPAPTIGELLRTPPWRWPKWAWGIGLGIGMLCGGIAAMIITLGPGLLWYDTDYLGMTRDQLDSAAPRVMPFLQHDRITLAGTMLCLGVLYLALTYFGLRQGIRAAERAFFWSGLIGFPTLLYFLGTGFLEPLHLALAVVLAPMLVAASRSHEPRRWTEPARPPDALHRRGMLGQLLVVSMSIGLIVAGLFISITGLTFVYVPTDLVYLGHDAFHLHELNPRLQSFAAHDRAGFGGTLLSAGVGLTLLTMGCWAPGRAWVWWTVMLSMVAGFVPALAIHYSVGYVDHGHLLPAYVGLAVTFCGVMLSRRYLCIPARGLHSAAWNGQHRPS